MNRRVHLHTGRQPYKMDITKIIKEKKIPGITIIPYRRADKR